MNIFRFPSHLQSLFHFLLFAGNNTTREAGDEVKPNPLRTNFLCCSFYNIFARHKQYWSRDQEKNWSIIHFTFPLKWSPQPLSLSEGRGMIGVGAADVHQDDDHSLQASDAFSKAGTGKTTFTDGADSPRISPLTHLHRAPYQNQRNHYQHHDYQHCHHHHHNQHFTIIITIVDTSASCLIPGLEAAALSRAQRPLLSIARVTQHCLLMRPFRSF